MKTRFIAPILFFIAARISAQTGVSAQTTNRVGLVQSMDNRPYAIVEQDANSRLWQRSIAEQGPSGELQSRVHRYIELATGLNYKDPQTGQWVESEEQIDILPTGAAQAVHGQYQVYFPADIFDGLIELVTPEGQHLKSRPLGISYYDGTNSVLIAELKHSIAQLLPSGNQIIYTNAFTDFAADLVLTYRKSGFESDLIFREQPSAPEAYGLKSENSRLELFTEFFDTADPEAVDLPMVGQEKAGGRVSDRGAFSGLEDITLKFGSTIMAHGKAFQIGLNAPEKGHPKTGVSVAKTWTHIEGRTFLIEAVPIWKIGHQIKTLPVSTTSKYSFASADSALHHVSEHRLLPVSHSIQAGTNAVQIANVELNRKPGLVLDYVTLNSDTNNYIFQADTTYLISGAVSISGTTTIQGGAVIKFPENSGDPSPGLYINGSLLCETPAYRMAIFTSGDDNSVGETITGSTGSPDPTNGCFQLHISTNNVVSNCRFAYAEDGIIALDNASIDVRDCEFEHSFGGISPSGDVRLHNVLFGDLDYALDVEGSVSSPAPTVAAENVTASYTSNLVYFNSDVIGTLAFTNAIVVGGFTYAWSDALAGYYPTVYTNDVACPADGSIFQTGPLGDYYLLSTDSALIDAGNTNADQVGLYQFTTQTNQVKETNSIVDLGYHYVALDSSGNPVDSDGDGIPDYVDDTNGDGTGNWTDFYNGVLPNITIVGGNNQSGMPNTFLQLPLTISVTDTNGTSLTNAPITFAVTQGGAQIATATNASFSGSVNLRTSANGQASVFMMLSSVLNTTNLLTATAWSGSQSNQVTFAEKTLGGMQLWLKSDTGITFGASNDVSGWADQGGLGNNGSQTTASKRAHCITNALNGFPIVRFDGVQDDFGFAATVLNTTTQAEAFVVLKVNATSHALWFFGGPVGSIYDASDGSISEVFGSTTVQHEGAPTQPLNQYHLYDVAAATNLWAARINGQLQYLNYINSYSNPGLDIGWGGPGGAGFFSGDIAEVLIFNRVLTSDERNAVGSYLGSKYALLAVPSVPTNLVATSLSPSQIGLTWNFALTNFGTTFQIERKTGAGGAYAQIAQLQDTMSYVDTNLSAGTQYYYRVRASDFAGTSDYSNETNATTFAGGTDLPLGNLRLWLRADGPMIRQNTNHTVEFWFDQSGNTNDGSQTTAAKQALWVNGSINGRPIVRFDGLQDDFGFAATVLNTTTQAEAFVVLKANATGHPLWFVGNNAGSVYDGSDGSISDVFGSTAVQSVGIPTQPLNQYHLYDVAAATNLWAARINGQLQYQNSINTYSNPGLDIGWKGSGSSFLAGDIAEVLIFNRVLTSDERDAVGSYLSSKYALVAAPQAPTNLVATALSPSQIGLTWKFALTNFGTTFQIERKTGPGGTYAQIAQLQDTMSYVDTNLSAGTQYYYRVKASDFAGISGYSNETNATTFAGGTDLPLGDLRLWLRADGPMIRQNTNHTVEYWFDQSGNTNDGSQTTAAKQALWVDGSINGRPIVRFDGSQDDFGFAATVLNTTTQAEAFVVLKANTTGHALWFFGGPVGSIYDGSDGSISDVFGSTAVQSVGIPSQPLNQYHLYDVAAATNLWAARINGQLQYSNNVNTYSNPGLDIGWGGPGGAGFFSGDIAEVLIFNRFLTSDERAGVVSYINKKYVLVRPAVTLTSPTNNTVIIASSDLSISANASDTAGTITQVEFFQGTTSLGIVTNSPYSITWSNVPSGTYSLTAQVTDDGGLTATSQVVTVIADIPPSVTLTSPANNALLAANANITLTASASDSDGTVAQVEFFQGTNSLGIATSAPYSVTWSNVPQGNYVLTARATDNIGITNTSSVVGITVDIAPNVALITPTNNAVFPVGSNITVSANASTAEGSVTQVQFFQGTNGLGTATNVPYSLIWSNVTAGTYSLTAQATGDDGLVSTSAVVNVTVDSLPSISIISPTNNGVIVPAYTNVTVTATATDIDGTIAQVQFFQGTTLLGMVTNSPYSVTWSNMGPGIYNLTASATDNNGLSTTSSVVNVTVAGVILTSPTNYLVATAPASIPISALVVDDVGITQVQFFQGSTSLGIDTSPPYSMTWSGVTTNVYSLTAVASDTAGRVLTSRSVTVIVDTNPSTSDRNGDGISDLTAYLEGRNPLATSTVQDTNGVINLQIYTPLK